MSIIQRRPEYCFTQELRDTVALISLNKMSNIVGSFSFIAHPYPGDIDMFEVYEENASPREVCLNLQEKFKQMAQRISKLRNVYMSDFKAGEDRRYIIDWNTTTSDIKKHIQSLFLQGLINRSETRRWLKALKVSKDLCAEQVRSRSVLRWSLPELINGVKHLPNNVSISLAECLGQQTIVKIDLIAPINGYYTEITNLFKLVAKDSKGRITPLSQPDADYEQSLLQDLKKYSDPQLGKRLKLAKRYWSYCSFKRWINELEKIRPLLESGAARLSQINSLIETLLILYNKLHIFPKSSVEQIQRLNFAIGSISHNILPLKDAMRICSDIQSINDRSSKRQIAAVLERVQDILHDVADHYAYTYLKKNGLLKKIQQLL